jgi:hypothetical protein
MSGCVCVCVCVCGVCVCVCVRACVRASLITLQKPVAAHTAEASHASDEISRYAHGTRPISSLTTASHTARSVAFELPGYVDAHFFSRSAIVLLMSVLFCEHMVCKHARKRAASCQHFLFCTQRIIFGHAEVRHSLETQMGAHIHRHEHSSRAAEQLFMCPFSMHRQQFTQSPIHGHGSTLWRDKGHPSAVCWDSLTHTIHAALHKAEHTSIRHFDHSAASAMHAFASLQTYACTRCRHEGNLAVANTK